MTRLWHILLAEDEDLIALAVSDFLDAEGFRVTVAHNGQQALIADENDPADLLVTDMRMPIMDGASLIRNIRTRHPLMPIIATTGYSESLPKEIPGLLVHMQKPYNLMALADQIRSLLINR